MRPKESRMWSRCRTGEDGTELHFLMQRKTFSDIRNKFNSVISAEPNELSEFKIALG